MTGSMDASARFLAWFCDDAAALWARNGYDRERGGFYEALHHDGAPSLTGGRRVRVQARQIYTFARIAERGWLSAAEQRAKDGFQFFHDHCCPDDGARGCIALIDDDGCEKDGQRDLYDQAFALLACAAMIDAFNDQNAISLSRNIFAFLEREMRSPVVGWLENDSDRQPRRQNPHMHLFEAMLALHRTTRDMAYLDCAKEIADIFETRFFDREREVLTEFFAADLKTPDPQKCFHVEPGHMMEWISLLTQFETATGKDYGKLKSTLYNQAKIHGSDQSSFLVNHIDIETNSTTGDRRLWPQTEFLRAAVIRADDQNHEADRDRDNIINNLFDSYLDHQTAGLWMDEFNSAGEPISEVVPASILYHLYEAAAAIADNNTVA